MTENQTGDWRDLCAAAAEEHNSEKLAYLVSQIIEAFDASGPGRGGNAARDRNLPAPLEPTETSLRGRVS
jgi:hypothetical protein